MQGKAVDTTETKKNQLLLRSSRSYVGVWNRPVACTMAIPDVEICMPSGCSPYGLNLFARWYQRLWYKRLGVGGFKVHVGGLKAVKSCSLGALPIDFFQTLLLCCRPYRTV